MTKSHDVSNLMETKTKNLFIKETTLQTYLKSIMKTIEKGEKSVQSEL